MAFVKEQVGIATKSKAETALHKAIHHFSHCHFNSCSSSSRFSSTQCLATAAIGLITDMTLVKSTVAKP